MPSRARQDEQRNDDDSRRPGRRDDTAGWLGDRRTRRPAVGPARPAQAPDVHQGLQGPDPGRLRRAARGQLSRPEVSGQWPHYNGVVWKGSDLARPKRSFSPEYREEAVKLVVETSRPIAQVAKELGITQGECVLR
ncbi:hypothetical protein E1281_11460 [Actinomadura sp. KC345]|nr:hypothetical protein E1281_11460 [Actinomadura sp. KC345]